MKPSMASPQESNSVCLKRKPVNDHISTDCKYRCAQAKNKASIDSSAECCNHCCTHPNLANDCANFLKSGAPTRIMYYEKGSWQDFPEQIMKTLIEKFKGGEASVVIVMDNEALLVDFLSMTLVNLQTRNQRSVAWFDGTCKCFLPSGFFDEEAGFAIIKGDDVKAKGTRQVEMLNKVSSSAPELVNQVALQSCPLDPQKYCKADILRKKMTYVKRDSEDFQFVQELFLSGMGLFATPENLLHVYRYSPNDIIGQCRLEAFERQMSITKEHCGDANVKYGWLGCRKKDIFKVLIDGLGTTKNPAEKSGLNGGVYLSPQNQAFTSVGLCDPDEKGDQFMLLCRVILGKMEAVDLGSQRSFPSSEMYDSGVDDCLNPRCYVIWPSHIRTHIRFEYLIKFKFAPILRNYFLGLKGLWIQSSPKQVAMDLSLKPHYVISETGQGSTTPFVSSQDLFAVIQENISLVAREQLSHHYEQLKESKIRREEMVQKMMTIVGEKIIFDALNKFQQHPSSSYKPYGAASSEPARAATVPPLFSEDSRAANAPGPVNSPLIGTYGSDPLSLTLSVMPQGHDETPVASNQEPKCPESSAADRIPQRYQHEAQDAATMVHSAPAAGVTMNPNDQVAPCGSHNEMPMTVHPGSHVIQAADVLLALSTAREKGEN